MQLTIIGDKLSRLSVEEFKHEFRNVHARDTKEVASSLGLISRYTQGLRLSSVIEKTTSLPILPLQEHPGPYQSLAQLTWPSVVVLQGALQSAGYKESAAAKHEFADPQHLFLTEKLEPEQKCVRNGLARPEKISKTGHPPVVLIVALKPRADIDEAEFRRRWANHANQVGTTATDYQRNAVMPVSRSQVQHIFSGTQFPADKCWDGGGYEEFYFDGVPEVRSFCEQHGEAMSESYKDFCDSQNSWYAVFDFVEQWGFDDIGLKQRLVGTALSTMLTLRTSLGI